jgi:hypothetical protein
MTTELQLHRFKLTKGPEGEIELRWLDDDGDWMYVVEISQDGKLQRNADLSLAEGHPFTLDGDRIAVDMGACR